MKPSFHIRALSFAPFASLFEASHDELIAMGARRMVVDEKPGFPCRVSLVDAEVGETVLLITFTHHDVNSPYRGSGPIFVRRGAERAVLGTNEIPTMLKHRLLSIRAYDESGMITGAKVAQGSELEDVIHRFFSDERTSYLHVHNAAPCCYNCSVHRA
jgi:hypothetical protein